MQLSGFAEKRGLIKAEGAEKRIVSVVRQRSVAEAARKTKYIIGVEPLYSHSGGDSIEDPPVPIPNTEVKLYYAESTCLLRPGGYVVAGFQKSKVSTFVGILFF